MDTNNKKFHFIAIGGIGMSGLAKYLIELGCEVSGSDICESKYTKKLENAGAKIHIGHDANIVQQGMIIVASTAIRQDNPEIIRAKELGLKICHRSDILKMISDGLQKKEKPVFIGFSGTHGKTTTSGLCTYVLNKAGYAPSFCVGGIIPELDTNAQSADGNFFVAELDESDGTIVKYSPDVSVINNLEIDHIDFYKDGFQGLLDTFKTHLSKMKTDNPHAKIIVNNDCDGTKKLIGQNPEYKFVTFGMENADYCAKNICYEGTSSSFDVLKSGKLLCSLKLSVPGKHNIYNALAVCAALCEEGVDLNKIAPYFTSFTGMGRRFQLSAEFGNIKVIDDYAHHPSEIKTTLESAKNCTKNRLVAIFQPHRYSRLKGLWDDFSEAFAAVDKLFVLDIYAASEDPIEGISSEKFAKTVDANAEYVGGSIQNAAKLIAPKLKSGDFVVALGAGDITKIGKELENNFTAGV